MIIYQIHEYGGEWEDYYDYIKYSYLSKDMATRKLKQLEEKQLEYNKCNNCPLYYCNDQYCNNDCNKCDNTSLERAKQYCDNFKPCEHSDQDCMNRIFCDESYYKIEEVNVIESERDDERC